MAGLVVEKLSKRYPAPNGQDRARALDDLSFKTEPGELLAVVGPSGSGKTTLLRLIAGLEAPDSGTIHLNGTRLDRLPPEKRNVAMVFQHGALLPHLTVRENLASGLRWRGEHGDESKRALDVVSRQLGLTATLDRLPEALSGGERQRVALGRSALLKPDLFLLDEPLSHLDRVLRQQLRQEIRGLNRNTGTALIHVTHDQTEAMSIGDRIAVLHDGAIQQLARPAEIYDAPANVFVARFIGWRPMNLIEGSLSLADGSLCFQRIDVPSWHRLELPAKDAWIAQEGGPTLLGLRPEHFTIAAADEPAAEDLFEDSVCDCEYAGDAQYLELESGIAIKAPTSLKFHPGDALRIRPDLSRASLFAPTTGRRID